MNRLPVAVTVIIIFIAVLLLVVVITRFYDIFLWSLSTQLTNGIILIEHDVNNRSTLLLTKNHFVSTIVIDVTDHGVICDGIHDNTNSMQHIFNTIVPFQKSGRENRSDDVHVIVKIPKQCVVLTGPIRIQSTNYMTFQIDGLLQAWDITNSRSNRNNNTTTLLDMWPMIEPLITYGNSRDYGFYYQYQPIVYINNVTHLRITGTGTIDGCGQPWWNIITTTNNHSNRSMLLLLLRAGRPNLIQIIHSSYIEIDTITLQNSPFWTLHPVLSQYIHIHHMTISAPLYSPNVDGIDPDSCQHVLIEYVHIECGDDHIALKAGVCGTSSPNNCTDAIWSSGIYRSDNITVQHSTFGRGMGIAIGSEMSGGVENIFIYNNTIGLCQTGSSWDQGCGWGPALHIKTTIARGGYIQNVTFSNNIVWNTSMFILLEIGYQTNRDELPPTSYAATKVHDITFVANRAIGSATSVTFDCSIHDLCHNLTIIGNHILIPVNKHDNPWICHFVADDYLVAHNYPPGLEECLVNATLNVTSMLTDNIACV